MITLFICLCNTLAIILISGHIGLPEWFIIVHGVSMCFLFFSGCISECRKKERIEELEAKNRELEKKINYVAALLENAERRNKFNERSQ